MPVEEVITGLSEEEKGLAPLIQLVAEVRTLPQPELSLAQVNVQKQKVLQAARESKMQRPEKSVWKPPHWAFATVLAGGLAFLVLVGIILTASLLWIGQHRANSALLVDANGYVEVTSAKNADHWRALEQGDRVYAGQRIRTYPSSNATLRFVDGSELSLGPMTDLTFSQLASNRSGRLQVLVSQQSGETTHQVVPFNNETSSYVVQTPSGSASVHGTRFGVVVNPIDGVSHFAVRSGTVAVSSANREVPVSAGQVTTTRPNSAPETPAYMFDVTGILTAYSPSQLTVAGISIAITEMTEIEGEPILDQLIHVEGHVADGGVWVADFITTEAMPAPSSFSGTVDATGELEWVVGGISVQVDGNTAIDEGLGFGDAVNVTFIILDGGGRLATSIRSLANEEPPIEPPPGPNPGDEEEYVFEPDELEAEGCHTEFSLAGTLRNEGSPSSSLSSPVVLGYTILAGQDYLVSFELLPSSWEEIQPGETVTFTIHTILNDLWLTTPQAQFIVRVFVDQGSGGSGEPPALMVTLKASCFEPTQTATPTQTSTPEMTPTPTTTPTPALTPVTDCTGAEPQPHAVTLAERYGVTYETIMYWFCQGYGFGEIEHAYQLRDQTGQTVEYIFSLRASGMGWGNIRKLLTGEPKNQHDR